MNRRLTLLVLIFTVAGASASQSGSLDIGPEHQHAEYVIPYNVILGGLGGGLFEGHVRVYVDYDAVRPDDDPIGTTDNVTGIVTVNAFAPGTNVADLQFTSSVLETDCDSIEKRHEDGGDAAEMSWYSVAYELQFDGEGDPVEQCGAVIAVENIGQAPFTLLVNPSIYNNDGDPTQGNLVTLLAWLLWLVHFILTVRIRHPMMRVVAAFVGYGILLLPLTVDQENLFLLVQSLVFLYSVFRMTGEHR